MTDLWYLFSRLAGYENEKLLGFGLIIAYIVGVFLLGPLTGNKLLPVSVRISIAISIALPLYGFTFPISSSREYIITMVFQLLYGCLTGWVASLIFHAFQSSGRLIDDMRGMAQVTMLDPQQATYTSQFGMVLFLVCSLVFFYSGAFRLFIYTILRSATHLHNMILPGREIFVGLIAPFFNNVILITLPFCITFFILDIAFGILNRSIPALNVYFLLHQLKIVAGLFLMSLVMSNIENIKNFILNYFNHILYLTNF